MALNLNLAQQKMPKPLGVSIKVPGLGRTKDIIASVIDKFNTTWQTAMPIAPFFKKGNKEATAKAIFNFIKTNIKYKEDPQGIQYVLSPSVIVNQKFADCKGYSILAGSILHGLGIPFKFRFAKYINSQYPNEYSHVYIVIPNGNSYITLDPTLPTFNKEASGWSGAPYDYAVGRQYASNSAAVGSLKSFVKSKWQQASDWVQENAQNIKELVNDLNIDQKVKTVTLAPVRGAFLGLVRINFFALASRLYPGLLSQTEAVAKGLTPSQWQAYYNSTQNVLNTWYKWGGNRTEFKNVVLAGKDVKVIIGKKSDPGIKGIGVAAESSVAAIITAATPLLVTIIPLLLKDPTGQVPDGTDWKDPKVVEAAKKKEEDKKKNQDMIMYGGAALLAFMLITDSGTSTSSKQSNQKLLK